MCLGELCEILELGPGATAVARTDARTQTISLMTLDETVAPGDWVVVHSGFALARLDPDEADEALTLRASVPALPVRDDTVPALPVRDDTVPAGPASPDPLMEGSI